MRRMSAVSALVPLLLGMCFSALANTTGTVSVSVMTPSAQPITNAEINAVFFEDAKLTTGNESHGWSDSNGLFIASGATVGFALVTTKKSGYSDRNDVIQFDGSGPWSTNLTVIMNQIPAAGVTLRVKDQDGQPIPGAEVYMSFQQSLDEGLPDINLAGQTGSGGEFVAAQKTVGLVGGGVTKGGYYKTSYDTSFFGNGETSAIVSVILKERKSPIPMYAKEVTVELPNTNVWYGYDLVVGDWVYPAGKGMTNDLLLRRRGYWTNNVNYEFLIDLSFSSPSDGLVDAPGSGDGSDLRSQQEAPATGYQNEKAWYRRYHGGFTSNCREDMNYYMRVRSVANAQGDVMSALYGKIYGDVGYQRFTYYLNPDGTRNVEFDPRKNLFPTPGGRGQISAP